MKHLMIITLLTLTLLCVSCGPGSPVTPDSPYIDINGAVQGSTLVLTLTALDGEGIPLVDPPMSGEVTIAVNGIPSASGMMSNSQMTCMIMLMFPGDLIIDVTGEYEGAPITGHAVFMN